MATAQQSATLSAYTLASVQATTALRDRLQTFVEGLWTSLGVYRRPQMTEFTSQAVPMVEAAMAQMSSMTSGYLAAVYHDAGFSAVPLTIPAPTVRSVRGVPATEVYQRPFHLLWRELHDGKPVDKAIGAGMQRAVQSALTDVQLAKTHTAQQIARNTPVTARPYWYRRVLEGPKNCALCVVASTQAYHVGKLLPIHPGCDCGVEPQWTAIPGHVVDEETLTNAHDAIMQTFGVSDAGARRPDYRKLILEQTHSELGPVLTVVGHHFSDLEAIKSGLDLSGVPHA